MRLLTTRFKQRIFQLLQANEEAVKLGKETSTLNLRAASLPEPVIRSLLILNELQPLQVAMENDKIHEYIPKISLIYFFIIFAFF
jgi:hypothetical protein